MDQLVIDRVRTCVGIAQFGMSESLNLGIILYEVTEQRRLYQIHYRKKGKRQPIRSGGT